MNSHSPEIISQLEEISAGRFQENVPLAPFTTYRTGGNARFLVRPVSTGEVSALLTLASSKGLPVFFLGAGSNILVSDKGFPGLVICTGLLNKIVREGEKVKAQAGVRLASLLKFCLEQKLSGLEFLAGIPGSVGGAVVMNAGLKDQWLSSRITSVTLIDKCGQFILPKEKIAFSYRSSGLENSFVFSAEFMLVPEEYKKIHDRISSYMKERRRKIPLPFRTAGSVFKNPEGFFAGQLIESCGLKGVHIGGAQISPVHGNIIINTGQASSSDIWELIQLARKEVAKKFNIFLKLELHCVGGFNENSGLRRG